MTINDTLTGLFSKFSNYAWSIHAVVASFQNYRGMDCSNQTADFNKSH